MHRTKLSQGMLHAAWLSRWHILFHYLSPCPGEPALTLESCPSVFLFRGCQACQSKFECFSNAAKPKAYFIWDRIKKITPKHVNGTICLASKRDEDGKFNATGDAFKLYAACKKYWGDRNDNLEEAWIDRMTADPDTFQWVESYAGLGFEMKGKRVNVTDW